MSLETYDYLDGNAAAGELNTIFAMDVTAAEGQCAHCGATKRFAEAHLHMQGPGIVARLRRLRACAPSFGKCPPPHVP
jgi:hypothetical protein